MSPFLVVTPAGWFGGPGRQYFGGRDALSDNENKTLRTLSNRNTNESRKLATLSKSI
jgi:hypothetical protein